MCIMSKRQQVMGPLHDAQLNQLKCDTKVTSASQVGGGHTNEDATLQVK